MKAMYYIRRFTKTKFIIITILLKGIQCTIDGSLPKPKLDDTRTGDNPCNPLYWYPRSIPEHCYISSTLAPKIDLPPIPMPIPVPVPIPPPIALPVPPPPIIPPIMMPHPGFPPVPPGLLPGPSGFSPGFPSLPPGFPPVPPGLPLGPPPPVIIPQPIMPLPISLPFGIPLAPTNPMAPVAGIPLPLPPLPPPPPPFPMPHSPYLQPYPPPYPPHYPSYPPRTIGMVPGIHGLVSPDGGINILPFSDVYSDMLERHKQKMIRRKLQKLLEKYEKHPWKIRKHIRRNGEDVGNEEMENDE